MNNKEYWLKAANGIYLGPLDYESARRMWEQDTSFIGIVEKVPTGSEVVDPIDGTISYKE